MPASKPVDHSGKQIGPLTVLEHSPRKRHWRVRCTRGHVSERRIDVLLRLRPQVVTCTVCRRSESPDAGMSEAFRNFTTTLAPIQRTALRRLLDAAIERR